VLHYLLFHLFHSSLTFFSDVLHLIIMSMKIHFLDKIFHEFFKSLLDIIHKIFSMIPP